MIVKARTSVTYRLLPRIVEGIGVGLDGFARDLVGPATVVSETARTHADIDFGHAEGFAIVQRLNRRQELEVFFEQIGQLRE